MQEVVGVQFKQASKMYYFNPKGKKFSSGEEVVVDTASGLALGIVAKSNFEVNDSEIEPPLREVIRLATSEDFKKREKLKERAKTSLPIIVEKIEKLNLPMKVVEVQYSFDETKVTITYTSDDRVDFRELLKVLASALKVKIELRQISIRDEVKSVGALGLCGRPCCCTSFLKEPEHVVVKMAKTQNMSLSPTKTGGACGKMMCCLAYEEPVYREILSYMPKVGSKIDTPEGEGVVQFNDIIKEKVTVKILLNDGSYKFEDFTLEQLGLGRPEKAMENKKQANDNVTTVTELNSNLETGANLVAKENAFAYNKEDEVVQVSSKNEHKDKKTNGNFKNNKKHNKFHHFNKKGDK